MMNFKFEYSWSPRGSFVIEINSKLGCAKGEEGGRGAVKGREVGAVPGTFARIRTIK